MTERGTEALSLVPVDWDDPRAVALRQSMDVEIGARYVDPESSSVDQAVARALVVDPADVLVTILVLDADATPIAHGALRTLRVDWEVKRLIVADDRRGRGVGRALMTELERIAWAGGADRVILQTVIVSPRRWRCTSNSATPGSRSTSRTSRPFRSPSASRRCCLRCQAVIRTGAPVLNDSWAASAILAAATASSGVQGLSR